MRKDLIVYLRPFSADSSVFVKNPEASDFFSLMIGSIGHVFGTRSQVALEEVLMRAVDKFGFMVEIGGSYSVGGGRISSSNEDWKAKFKKIASAAKAIIVLPSASVSVKWELEWIAANRLHEKTFFIFCDRHGENDSDFNIAGVKQIMKKCGFQIPDNIQAGSLISFDEKGGVYMHIEKSDFSIKSIREMLLSIVDRRL